MCDNNDATKSFIKISDIDEETKKEYIQELEDMYSQIRRKASDFWSENSAQCPHCTGNRDLKEENIALALEKLNMKYHYQRDVTENSSELLETVFSDAEEVFNLFDKYNDYNDGETIGWEVLTNDLLATQIHHAAFIVSKSNLSAPQRELISSLMHSCVVEARKIIEENFFTLKTIFRM